MTPSVSDVLFFIVINQTLHDICRIIANFQELVKSNLNSSLTKDRNVSVDESMRALESELAELCKNLAAWKAIEGFEIILSQAVWVRGITRRKDHRRSARLPIVGGQ